MKITRVAIFARVDKSGAEVLRDAKLPSSKLFDGEEGVSIRDNSGGTPDLEGDKAAPVWVVVYDEDV